jgi:phosphoenolpyruvate carboxylase
VESITLLRPRLGTEQGTALAALDEVDRAKLREKLRARPFVHYVFTNVESSLASSDLSLMRAYAGLVQDETVRSATSRANRRGVAVRRAKC